MPLYEYECPKDGRFELIRRFSDPPLKKCPTCGGRVEKLASAPAFQFKGTGWYVTDYAKKSGGDGKSKNGDTKASGEASAKPEPSSKTEASSKAESKSDSTPAKASSKDGSASGGSSTSKATS